MLRSSVRLLGLLSPLTQSCRSMGRARMWNTRRKPMFLEFNERRQMVELDGMLKVGLVSHWYYITSDITGCFITERPCGSSKEIIFHRLELSCRGEGSPGETRGNV